MEKANSSKWKRGSNSVALRYGLCFVSLGQGERPDSCGRRRGPPPTSQLMTGLLLEQDAGSCDIVVQKHPTGAYRSPKEHM